MARLLLLLDHSWLPPIQLLPLLLPLVQCFLQPLSRRLQPQLRQLVWLQFVLALLYSACALSLLRLLLRQQWQIFGFTVAVAAADVAVAETAAAPCQEGA